MRTLNEDEVKKIYSIWKVTYASYKEASAWLDFIYSKNSEQDIKNLNKTLDLFKEFNIEFKDEFLKTYYSQINANNILPKFSYLTIFTWLVKNHQISQDELPLNKIVDGILTYWKKSRFHFEARINFIYSLKPTEYLIEKLFDSYNFIHQNYTIELQEQKKILKLFNQYASEFIKSLDSEKQKNIFTKLDFICSGINSSTKEIETTFKEEYSLRINQSISNQLKNANKIHSSHQEIYTFILNNINNSSFDYHIRNINDLPKIGDLKFEITLFSSDKSLINTLKEQMIKLDDILTHDSTQKNLQNKEHYLNVFNKIAFSDKLLNNLEVKSSDKKHKI